MLGAPNPSASSASCFAPQLFLSALCPIQLLSLLLPRPQPKHHLVPVGFGMFFDRSGTDRTAAAMYDMLWLSFQLCPQETVARRQCRPSCAAKCEGSITPAPCWHRGVQTPHGRLAGGDPGATCRRDRGAREEDEKQRGTKRSSCFSAASNREIISREVDGSKGVPTEILKILS